jgi:hypothetical protein
MPHQHEVETTGEVWRHASLVANAQIRKFDSFGLNYCGVRNDKAGNSMGEERLETRLSWNFDCSEMNVGEETTRNSTVGIDEGVDEA